jgi:hypothetical protein
MQIPETPSNVEALDLMRRLGQYADGESWSADEIGPDGMRRCRSLYSGICDFVNNAVAPLLDHIGAREMEHFTMHDHVHALKVAHLMWHILSDERRKRLTPPEIGMLVLSAHVHDLGMAISPHERNEWLSDRSELWKRIESEESTKRRYQELQRRSADPSIPDAKRARIGRLLAQSEEALLCDWVRENHATRERYQRIIEQLSEFHHKDPAQFPDPVSVLSYGHDSFQRELVEVCISHNEEADVLWRADDISRFPAKYPVGNANVDLLMAAAALRLADILDFDRERTPPALFQYLMPSPLAPEEDRSVLEWRKHLAISNWRIEKDAIVFQGNCDNNIVHHAIVQFCKAIAKEIQRTWRAFEQRGHDWPFGVPRLVTWDIHARGYEYEPFQFELDHQRIYELLMGGAIYQNPLVCVRELVQNSVDACRYLDALSQLAEARSGGVSRPPDVKKRIFVSYYESSNDSLAPRLVIRDRGLGMNKYILETYFLRVGQSIYRSEQFNRQRAEFAVLPEYDLDFAPVSEFGIGFLSCFLLADRVSVETAMAEPWDRDNFKHTLVIDGPTRLIHYNREPNEGPARFKGTVVTVYLKRGGQRHPAEPPGWSEIKDYLSEICVELPYDLNLSLSSTDDGVIRALPMALELPHPANLLSVPLEDAEVGFEGQVHFEKPVAESGEATRHRSTLIRGGFKIGEVPGVPHRGAYARVRMTWKQNPSRRYLPPNLARTGPADMGRLRKAIARSWMTYFLQHLDTIANGHAIVTYRPELADLDWLDNEYTGWDVYRLARKGWAAAVGDTELKDWEKGAGRALRFDDRFYLHDLLLGLLLPRICEHEIDERFNVRVRSPHKGWEDELKVCQDFVRNWKPWPAFARFGGRHDRWLAVLNAPRSRFNELHRARVCQEFTGQEVLELLDTLDRVVRFVQFPEVHGWTDRHSQLWRRARQRLGDLEVGEAGELMGRPVRTLREPNFATAREAARAASADGLSSSDLL